METSTRDRILDAAMSLFSEKGYNATSIADILQRAEANSGSLYHFFPTKQDVLLAVLDTYRAGIHPMLLEPAWNGIEDPIERVFALLGQYREALVQTECFYGCPIGSLALELHEPDPAVRQRLAANFDGWVEAVADCFEQARARLPDDADTHQLAVFSLTTMEGGVMLARTHRRVSAFDEPVRALRAYVDSLLEAVCRK